MPSMLLTYPQHPFELSAFLEAFKKLKVWRAYRAVNVVASQEAHKNGGLHFHVAFISTGYLSPQSLAIGHRAPNIQVDVDDHYDAMVAYLSTPSPKKELGTIEHIGTLGPESEPEQSNQIPGLPSDLSEKAPPLTWAHLSGYLPQDLSPDIYVANNLPYWPGLLAQKVAIVPCPGTEQQTLEMLAHCQQSTLPRKGSFCPRPFTLLFLHSESGPKFFKQMPSISASELPTIHNSVDEFDPWYYQDFEYESSLSSCQFSDTPPSIDSEEL